jgi:hypothetical protein
MTVPARAFLQIIEQGRRREGRVNLSIKGDCEDYAIAK